MERYLTEETHTKSKGVGIVETAGVLEFQYHEVDHWVMQCSDGTFESVTKRVEVEL